MHPSRHESNSSISSQRRIHISQGYNDRLINTYNAEIHCEAGQREIEARV